MKPQKTQRIYRKGERGVSLLFILFAVAFVSGYILINLNIDSDRLARERADQTAWLVNELSQAARLYVRDQNAAGNAALQKSALCAAPVEITVNDLVNNGYLSNNNGLPGTQTTIGQRDATNTRFVTPLGQTAYIIAANSTINNAACNASALSSVAATAYVILQPGANVTPRDISNLASALSLYGIPTIPPQFDAGGNNVSLACGGGPATLQWDTGCLTQAQYTFLLPAVNFAANTIGVPAWLSSRSDVRAVSRYDQPENPDSQRMQTDLRMAPMTDTDVATCTQVQIPTGDPASPSGSTQVNSGVCTVTDDTGGTNNRRDITNTNSITASRIIVTPQATDVGGADVANDLNITGAATVTGNVRSYATADAIVADKNIVMTGASPGLTVAAGTSGTTPVMAVSNLKTRDINVTTGTITGKTNAASASTNISQNLVINGDTTINNPAGRGVLFNKLSGTATTLTVTGEAAIGGTTAVSGTATVNGTAGTLALAAARLDTDKTILRGDVKVGNDITTAKKTSINTIAGPSTPPALGGKTTCRGICPDRNPTPDPPL